MSEIPSFFSGIHELFAETVPEVCVVAAAAPFPVFATVTSVLVVAGARFDRPLAARPRYGVRHGRAGDRVDERRLSATCDDNDKKKKK